MEQYYGYFIYALSLLTMGGIYAVLTLGLNVQWGFTGLFNAGIAGFLAVGAYTQAILTTPISRDHLGAYNVPIPLAMLAAMLLSAAVAWAIAKICIRLRSDYLAIATIGIAEILRLVFKNEIWATNGPRGVSQIPKAFETLPQPWNTLAFLAMVLGVVAVIYVALEKARTAPWGRVMTAIRENETAAAAAGKNIEAFRLESFVIGSALMGLGGALMAQYLKQIDPNVSDPLTATFLVWVMLIAGGSANNRGAVLGAMLLYVVWSGSEIVSQRLLSLLSSDWIGMLTITEAGEWSIRFAYLRVFLIGLILQFILQKRPQGILPEVRPKPHPRLRGAIVPAVNQGD
jgi:branched-chain amino acid transport system permease protein